MVLYIPIEEGWKPAAGVCSSIESKIGDVRGKTTLFAIARCEGDIGEIDLPRVRPCVSARNSSDHRSALKAPLSGTLFTSPSLRSNPPALERRRTATKRTGLKLNIMRRETGSPVCRAFVISGADYEPVLEHSSHLTWPLNTQVTPIALICP